MPSSRNTLVLLKRMVATADICIKVRYEGGASINGRRARYADGRVCGNISSAPRTLRRQ
jgi:hypothetical protein